MSRVATQPSGNMGNIVSCEDAESVPELRCTQRPVRARLGVLHPVVQRDLSRHAGQPAAGERLAKYEWQTALYRKSTLISGGRRDNGRHLCRRPDCGQTPQGGTCPGAAGSNMRIGRASSCGRGTSSRTINSC